MLYLVNTFQFFSNLFRNTSFEISRRELWMGGFAPFEVKQNVTLKQNRPSWVVAFFFPVCLQGEVMEFIDEFLEDEYPVLESPPKHWKTNNKKAPTLQSLYLFGFVQIGQYSIMAKWFKDNDDDEDRHIFTFCFIFSTVNHVCCLSKAVIFTTKWQ